MRYEKAEIIHRIALDMQGTAEGISLEEIRSRYTEKALSRRTAERLRDTVERLYPIVHANPGEFPKRWRIHGRSAVSAALVTADELTDLATASSVLKREKMLVQARSIEKVLAKLKAQMSAPTATKLAPDIEALTEAEGLAMRPGPRQKIDGHVVSELRRALLSSLKVRIDYFYLGSGKRGFETVHPYGFLYGNRHYLVAWSENSQADDFRNYALANIEKVTVLDRPFKRKQEFSLARYAEESFGVFRERPFDVEWLFDRTVAKRAKEFLFHPTQKITQRPDGSLLVRFKAGGLIEMAWHLYTWGKHVKVLKPKNFDKRIGNTMKRALP
jgi:predicted DNA-binding transcriptional regulator YafY